MKELLVVGAGNMGRPYLAAANELGLRVRVLESPEWVAHNEPDQARSAGPVIDLLAEADPDNRTLDEVWASGVYRAITSGSPDGVLAFAEYHVLSAALAQEVLGLPGPSLHAAVLSRNKALQRARFAAAGIPQPRFHLASGIEAAATWAANRLPVVMKPLSASGSFGVELIRDNAELADCVRRRKGESPILVEAAVAAPEFSWEGFVRDGEVIFGNITKKETTPPPRFVEIGHQCGHEFESAALREAVANLVGMVLAALRMMTGVVHLEFWLTADGPVMGEVAVRTPGDYLYDQIGLAYGFSPYRVAVQLAMGMPADLPGRAGPVRHTGVWFPTSRPGTVAAVRGVDEVSGHPGVERVAIDVAVGDTIPDLLSSRHRIGHVLLNAGSADERDEALEYARSTIQIAIS